MKISQQVQKLERQKDEAIDLLWSILATLRNPDNQHLLPKMLNDLTNNEWIKKYNEITEQKGEGR